MFGKMKCKNCCYIYDPEKGESRWDIKSGTEWKDVPDNFICPFCGGPKKMFKPLK